MTVLSLWSPEGGVLGFVAPLAMAAAAGTCLVIDLDAHGPAYPGEASLARLVADRPRRSDLVPARRGVAVLRNGGVAPEECRGLVEALCGNWPAVVLRVRPGPGRPSGIGPRGSGVVPVRPLLPGGLLAPVRGPAVHQRCGWGVRPDGPGPVLPRPAAATIRALLEGRAPVPDRWIRSWRQVWEAAWT